MERLFSSFIPERRRETASQFLLFAAVGSIGTIVHYAVLITLVQVTSMKPVPATAFGFISGALVNYALNYRFTFHSRESHVKSIPKFYTLALVGFFINSSVVAFLSDVSGLHYLLSQAVATGIVLLWNFIGNKLWTFRHKDSQ